MGNNLKASTKKSKILRFVLPSFIILIWLSVAGIGGPYFGRIDEVASNDFSTFLPKSAESTKVNAELKKYNEASTIPAVVVFESNTVLNNTQINTLNTLKDNLSKKSFVKRTVPQPIISEDKKAAFLVVSLDSNSEFDIVIAELKENVSRANTGLPYKITGPAMFSRDINKAFAGIDGTLLFVALGVVFAILLIVYRSPLLPIITLMGSMIALSAAIIVVWYMAKAGILQLNGQVQGILFILVIGAATDYSLLYIARFKEELTKHESALSATVAALKAAWEPIVAAGGTVILGLLCLLVSDLASNKALGPVGGIGVLFSILSALTFLPAVLLLFGRSAFWPRRPKYANSPVAVSYKKTHPSWTKVSELVARYPRQLWIGIMALLIFLCLFVPQLKAVGVSQEDLIIGPSEARDGQMLLNKHFPSGSGSPSSVTVPVEQQNEVVALIEKDTSVDTVSVVTTDPVRQSAPVGKFEEKIKNKLRDAIVNESASQMVGYAIPIETLVEQAYPFNGLIPKVRDSRILLQVTLKYPASSVEARAAIQRLRDTIHKQYPDVRFGGVSAIQLDTSNASERDLKVIIPLILAAITIVLMLLLRSIIAPLVLLLTTVISFGATIGLSALLFNNVWKFSGADPSVIIFGFVFLVALGIDYNIFLMTRVREETKHLGVKNGTLKAVAVTGGVITSAGIVLASTFAALYVIPILFLAQIAFIVAFGVLLDTLIVRSLLVPALTLEIGNAMWWPSKLWKKKKK